MIFVSSRLIPFLHFEALVYPINRYGDDIRAGKLGKSETVFTLGSLKPRLPSELRDDMVIRSFSLAEMKQKDGALYVSGLLYKRPTSVFGNLKVPNFAAIIFYQYVAISYFFA